MRIDPYDEAAANTCGKEATRATIRQVARFVEAASTPQAIISETPTWHEFDAFEELPARSISQLTDLNMIKANLIAILLTATAGAAFAQASAPAASASAPAKHRILKKLKNHKPGASAVDPERSPDKKGGA